MAIAKYLRRHPRLKTALAVPLAARQKWRRWRQKPADAILERVSDLVKGTVLFEAKEFDAFFSINPRSHLLRRVLNDGYYEPRVSSLFFACIERDKDVLDIGANIGFYTVGGAKKLTTGRLLAAEPTAEAFDRLKNNVALNDVADRVILFKGLVGSSTGQAEIRSVPGLEEYSSIHAIQHFAVKDEKTITETVSIEPVDVLVARHDLHPALMKVDVEGAEYQVFAGARQTLSRYRPVVLSEIWRESENSSGHSGKDIVQMFQNLDYIVLDPHDPLSEPGIHDIGEIICIPKEKYSPAMLK